MSNRVGFELTMGPKVNSRRNEDEGPLRVLVLTELSNGTDGPPGFAPRRVDIEGIDAWLSGLGLSLTDPIADLPGAGARIAIESMDQLHPDYLARALPTLGGLLELKRLLADPQTEQVALAKLEALTGRDLSSAQTAEPQERTEAAAAADNGADDDTLERLLGRPATSKPQDRARESVNALIKQALGTATTERSSGAAQSASETLAHALNEHARSVMMDPKFRAIERAARSVHWLVSRLEEDEAEVHVIDVAKNALAQHLTDSASQLEASPLHRLLVDDEDGWDLIVGDYSFDLRAEDIVLLATIGALAARANAPFIAHGKLALAGCARDDAVDSPWDWSLPDDDIGRLWLEFRKHPAAAWIGLAAPRFLLRYPYGSKSDATDVFDFEELPSKPERERFLWANPAYACALLMGQAHGRGGSSWPSASAGDVQDLPTPVFDDGTGDDIQAPLEFLLNERARIAAAQQGLIVFAGGRNANHVTVSSLMPLHAR